MMLACSQGAWRSQPASWSWSALSKFCLKRRSCSPKQGTPKNHAFMINVAIFFCGCLLCLSLDMIAQFIVNRRQRSAKELEHYTSEDTQSSALLGTGLMAAIALTLHNLPEGIVTFLGTLEDADVGISLALAIGVHNIPEGVAVAMPILKATGSKTKAFLWTLLASVAQPIGGILAWLALANILTPASIAVMMSVTAGIMVYVGVVKLQKEAISRDPSDTWSGYGFILGMAVMALSLVLFKIR
ncbi:Zinc transporter [Perkinsus olseni]|uniref:Zinc transporter n=1 Tax=Perkinsus olseni TaxID=32597 RepID=A0A7J6PIA5_PEROL|nr:Zinc transporter [Perkinsus olseni]